MSKNNGPKWGKQIAWWGVAITAACLFASKISIWNEVREHEARKKAAQQQNPVRYERVTQERSGNPQAVNQTITCTINEKGQKFCTNVAPTAKAETPAPKNIKPAPEPTPAKTTAAARIFDNFSPKDLAIMLGGGLVLIIACYYYLKSYDKPRPRKQSRPKERTTAQNYSTYTGVSQKQSGESLEMRHLLHMLLHDRKAAERLIAYEKELDPSLTREECIREAIARIRRDQRG